MTRLAFLALLSGAALAAAPSRTTLQPSDLSANSYFGFSLSASGNLLAVGAPLLNGNNSFGQGAVYVYQRSGGNGWSQQARLMAPAPEFNDDFGISVALENNTLIVGAPRAAGGAGRVYQYRLANGAWTLQQTFTSPTANDVLFGNTVAFHRGTLAIGMGLANTASVYLYDQTAAGWSAPTRLQSFSLGFGSALALQEDTLVAAAPYANTVFVYQRRNRAWSLNAEIPAPGSAGLFGWSVALHRGRIAIGAPAGSFEGSVHVYSQVNGAWAPALAVNATAVGVAPEAQFGTSVSLFDTTLAAGASNSFVGTATTVTLSGNSFTPAGQRSADSGGPEALFGRQVLVPDNNTLIVTSPGWSSATTSHLGAVDIFQQ